MSCVCDYDPADLYQQAIHKARKAHRCEECGGPIVPGEEYERVFGVWEGSPSTFKTCSRCVDLRTWVTNNVPCVCWAHGNLFEDLRATVDDAKSRAPAETVGLLFGFVRRRHAITLHNRAARKAAA